MREASRRYRGLPADVLGHLLVRGADQQDRVVARYRGPSDDGVEPSPHGPQTGVQRHGQEHQLQGGGGEGGGVGGYRVEEVKLTSHGGKNDLTHTCSDLKL